MDVLVTGLLPYDSGKTTFAKFLIEGAIERGIDVGFSKPISGISGWYQYKYIVKSIEAGILIGEDMFKLHIAAKSSDPIEYEGPVVSLLLPPDPEKVGWKVSVYSPYSNQISVIRISDLERTKHYYVPSNIERAIASLKGELRKLLNIVKAEPVDAKNSEKLILNSRKYADKCLDYLKDRHEFFVVESYNNSAAPTAKALEVDLVVVVTPGKAAIFSGSSYKRAILALSSIKDPWKVVTEDVISLLEPILVIDVKTKKTDVFEKIAKVAKASNYQINSLNS
ncbi:MAG: ATPase [Archaeoglobus sp.]|nr:MAG: ATPase [Archaeoglobus sp.]